MPYTPGDPYDYEQNYGFNTLGAVSGIAIATAIVWPAANIALGEPFENNIRRRLATVDFSVVTASGNYAVAIYNALTGTRVGWTGGAIAMGAAGAKSWAANLTLDPGAYIALLSVDNVVAAIGGISNTALTGWAAINGELEGAYAPAALPANGLVTALSARTYTPRLILNWNP